MGNVPPLPERSSRPEVEKSLPPSLLESCIPPRREPKDSKTIPKPSARIRQEPSSATEDVHVSPQEEPLGTGDFAAISSERPSSSSVDPFNCVQPRSSRDGVASPSEAAAPLHLRGRPSPLVKRRLFGTSASSSQPSSAKESPLQLSPGPRPSPVPDPSPDDATAGPRTSVVDSSVDRSRSATVDVRPSKGHNLVPVLSTCRPTITVPVFSTAS
ncbi:uncharacterized protein [Palaemon carinicauda]|uniref:uncharacterized protein n=1 Tax=Palaemon carinicauda TaxID=392227 RepID=UPI0035B668B7